MSKDSIKLSVLRNNAREALESWRKGNPANDMADVLESLINCKITRTKPQEEAVDKFRQEKFNSYSLENELYYIYENPEDYIDKETQEVLYCKENQLQLDIDSKEKYNLFLTRIFELRSLLGISYSVKLEAIEYFSSSGPPKRHIIVSLFKSVSGKPYKLNKWERIVFQFVLGSDQVRETMNVFRILIGVDEPVRLIKPKSSKETKVNI